MAIAPEARRNGAAPLRGDDRAARAGRRSGLRRRLPRRPGLGQAGEGRVEESLAFAVACGAESTQHLGAGALDPARRRAARRPGHGAAARAPRRRRLSRPGGSRPPGPLLIPQIAHAALAGPAGAAAYNQSFIEVRRRAAEGDHSVGSRDRTGQEGSSRLRVRRHRDRAVEAHAGPRRHRHHLEPRPLPLRAAAARLGDGRGRQPEDRGRDRPARRPRRAQPRGHLVPLRGRGRAARADREGAARARHPAHAGDLRRARQAGADRPADRGDQGRRARSPAAR